MIVLQLKWRLREGHGEAIYEIGVEDSGLLTGLPVEEMADSLETLELMARRLGASTTILRERTVETGRLVAEVLVRKVIRLDVYYTIIIITKYVLHILFKACHFSCH